MRHSCILVALSAAQDPSGGVGEGCKGRIFSVLHLIQLSLALCGQVVVFFFFSEFQHVAVLTVGSSRASRPSRRLSCASFFLGACRSILLGCPANEPRI